MRNGHIFARSARNQRLTPLEAALHRSSDLPPLVSAAILGSVWIGLLALDATTSPELSMQDLYLVPLCFTTWCFGRGAGLLTGGCATATAIFLNDFGGGQLPNATASPTFVTTWNTGANILAALFVIFLVSAFRRVFDREREHARVDPLTGLGNRRAFEIESRRLALSCKRDRRIMVCGLIDMDDFKSVNDRYGHNVGDAALTTLAVALRSSVRPYDVIRADRGRRICFLPCGSGRAVCRTQGRTYSSAFVCRSVGDGDAFDV